MDDLRTQIQTKLSTLTDVDCGIAVPDDAIVEGTTYFGYELQEVYYGSDMEKNYKYNVILTGRIVRKNDPTENTISIVDGVLEEIKSKLKELNFKCSYNDVSIDNGIRKIYVSATASYYELNRELII